MLVIVPNALSDAIYAAIDKALNGRPCVPEERESLYHRLLGYYDEHGVIPDFTLREEPQRKVEQEIPDKPILTSQGVLISEREANAYIKDVRAVGNNPEIPESWDSLCHECGWRGVWEVEVAEGKCPDCGSTQVWERMEQEPQEESDAR